MGNVSASCWNDPGPLALQGSPGPWNGSLAPLAWWPGSTADFNLLILFLAFLHALRCLPHACPLLLLFSEALLRRLELTSPLPADSPQTLTPDPLQELPVPGPSKHRALASLSSLHTTPLPTVRKGQLGPPTGLVAVFVTPAGLGIRGSGQEPADIPAGSGAAGPLSESQEEQSPRQAGSS